MINEENTEVKTDSEATQDRRATSCSVWVNAATDPVTDGYYLITYGGNWRKAYFSVDRNEWSEGRLWGVGVQNHELNRPSFWSAVSLPNSVLGGIPH